MSDSDPQTMVLAFIKDTLTLGENLVAEAAGMIDSLQHALRYGSYQSADVVPVVKREPGSSSSSLHDPLEQLLEQLRECRTSYVGTSRDKIADVLAVVHDIESDVQHALVDARCLMSHFRTNIILRPSTAPGSAKLIHQRDVAALTRTLRRRVDRLPEAYILSTRSATPSQAGDPDTQMEIAESVAGDVDVRTSWTSLQVNVNPRHLSEPMAERNGLECGSCGRKNGTCYCNNRTRFASTPSRIIRHSWTTQSFTRNISPMPLVKEDESEDEDVSEDDMSDIQLAVEVLDDRTAFDLTPCATAESDLMPLGRHSGAALVPPALSFPTQAPSAVPPVIGETNDATTSSSVLLEYTRTPDETVIRNAVSIHETDAPPSSRRPRVRGRRRNKNENNAEQRAGPSAPSRKQVARACDPCRQRRVGCDGSNPCARCQTRGLECTYSPVREKRASTNLGGANSFEERNRDSETVNSLSLGDPRQPHGLDQFAEIAQWATTKLPAPSAQLFQNNLPQFANKINHAVSVANTVQSCMSFITNARSDIMRNEHEHFQLANNAAPNDPQKQFELLNLAIDAHLKCALIHRLILRLKQLVPDGPSGMNPAQPQPPQQNNESALLAGGMGQLAGAPGAHNFNQAGQPHPTSDGRFVVGMQEKTIQQQQPAGLQPNGQPQLGHGMQLPQIDGMNQAWRPGLNPTAPGHSPQPPNGLAAGLSAPQLNNPSGMQVQPPLLQSLQRFLSDPARLSQTLLQSNLTKEDFEEQHQKFMELTLNGGGFTDDSRCYVEGKRVDLYDLHRLNAQNQGVGRELPVDIWQVIAALLNYRSPLDLQRSVPTTALTIKGVYDYFLRAFDLAWAKKMSFGALARQMGIPPHLQNRIQAQIHQQTIAEQQSAQAQMLQSPLAQPQQPQQSAGRSGAVHLSTAAGGSSSSALTTIVNEPAGVLESDNAEQGYLGFEALELLGNAQAAYLSSLGLGE